MTTRGWYKERTLTTVDTVGREVPVTTGLTRDPEGRLVAAIAISDGPTAIYRYSGDTKTGQVNGQGFVHFGGSWWVDSAAGTKITSKP